MNAACLRDPRDRAWRASGRESVWKHRARATHPTQERVGGKLLAGFLVGAVSSNFHKISIFFHKFYCPVIYVHVHMCVLFLLQVE